MIKSIKLKNYRPFEELEINTNNQLVIISGRNATGKTSILEAIYLCSTSKSHRTNKIENVIKENSEFSVVELEADKKYRIAISNNGKSFFIGSKEYKKISDFIGNLKVVLFSPSDLNLINGSKGERRHFLDLELSLIDKTYLEALTAYKKLLKERNEILKALEVNNDMLNVITNQMIDYVKIILDKRYKFIDKLNSYLKLMTKKLKCEDITLKYVNSCSDNLYESYKNKEKYDLFTKTTNIGPHRDDFEILINSNDAYEFASEGQKRCICIALKMAIKENLEALYGDNVILLLDDVFAALDNIRIESLVNYVKNNHQTIITTASILDIPDILLKDAAVIRIDSKKENGKWKI